MNYQKFGVSPEQVERVKKKLKNQAVKDRVKQELEGITKADLQDKTKVKRFIKKISGIMNEPYTAQQEDNMAAFIVAQKIDPNNIFHLMKLWAAFR